MYRGSSPALVGRTEQLAVLAEALAGARQDGHPALLIGGEAGVGKSRLLAEFAATAPDARVLAADLFISAKTASVDVSNIMAKLGAANRTEAAAIANRNQLV